MKIKILVLILLLLPFLAPNARAAIITFDDLSLGVYGDTLTIGDVTIKSQMGGKLAITDQTADGFGNAHSLPNKLSVFGDEPLVPKEKASFLIFFDNPIQSVNFWITGNGHDTNVDAYNADGNLVDSFLQTYPMNEPTAPDGRPWDYYYDGVLRLITLEASDISKVTVQPSAYDGFSIDDLSYTAIPEPSTMLLMLSGLLGLPFVRRKK
ncbi:MAG TPA: PEP-CTERM sorting domain-containing protein [Candidatus Omnitrophota bacterium]|nr:PEP-CTERM sorting domain-containing protein [Candidatus Omnitrophota bacterium]